MPCCGGVIDFFAGAVDAIMEDNIPVATSYVNPNGSSSYRAGAKTGHVLSMISGAAEIITGAGGDVAAGAGELVTLGAATPVAVPLAAGSTATLLHGMSTFGKAAYNLNSQGTQNSNAGTRRQNRIPDTGTPNFTATNPSGTTTKKYGPDGNVQKEFNKGHQGNKVPKNERNDHVHDHKPKPNRHPNDPQPTDRQPGRPPKKGEIKKDFGL